MKIRCVLVAAVLLALVGLSGCEWLWFPDVIALGFAPAAGAVGTTVTIVGEGFGAIPVDTQVTLDGVEATIVVWTDTNIIIRIPVVPTPTGTRNATVRVTQGGALLGSGVFTVVRGILFETSRDGNSEIYVMNPDGSQPTNLTNHPGYDASPTWSPNGVEIAFVSERDGNAEIYTMDADGANPRNRTNHLDDDYFPMWSPNGNKIAYMTDRESNGIILDVSPKIIPMLHDVEVFVMNADGTGQTNVSNDPAWDGRPTWSADSTKIAFQSERDDSPIVPLAIIPEDLGSEIYSVNVDGTNPTRLTWSPEDDAYPSWSPNGAKIAFQSYRSGNWEIYTMNPDGSGQTQLTNHPGTDSNPTWSPDSSWVTFHSTRDGNGEIYRTSSIGTATSRLTTSAEWDGSPSWSLDGTQIVFQSFRAGNGEIYRMNADGSFQMRLTNDPSWDAHPFWGTFGWMPPL